MLETVAKVQSITLVTLRRQKKQCLRGPSILIILIWLIASRFGKNEIRRIKIHEWMCLQKIIRRWRYIFELLSSQVIMLYPANSDRTRQMSQKNCAHLIYYVGSSNLKNIAFCVKSNVKNDTNGNVCWT